MGVVNLSADSWYRESVMLNAEAAIRRGRVLHEQGAAIIDVGAESPLARAALVDAAAQHGAAGARRARTGLGRALRLSGDLSSGRHDGVPEGGRAGAEPDRHGPCRGDFREVADFDAGVIICFVQGAIVCGRGRSRFGPDPVASSMSFSRGRLRRRQARACRALDRSGAWVLLPEPAGQRRADPPPDAHFSE